MAMASSAELLTSIRASGKGLALAELLARHPGIARRTAQRLIAKLVACGQFDARGEGRARRYIGSADKAVSASHPGASTDAFPAFISLSADSQDILVYFDRPSEARKPVG